MTDDGSVVSGSPGERSTVTSLFLDVADDGTLWALCDGEDVSDVEGGLLSTVDEGTGGETLGSDKSLSLELVAVWVTEDDGGEWRTTSSVVDDVLYDTTDVTVSLGKVERTETSWVLSVVGVGLEDTTGLSLVADDSL